MTFPVVYQGAATVASGPMPGAKALMAWCLANYPPGSNLGIYNPRSVRGGVALSLHAEGRAIDVGYPPVRPDGHPVGQVLAADMVRHHAELGVQCVIFARRIWSNTRPTWRPYAGTADHFDHVHIELTREAAAGLTTDIIRQTLETPMPPTPASDDMVRQWQDMLLANGAKLGGGADGLFGRLTLEASKTILDHRNRLLAANGVSADTIVRLTAERDAARAEVVQVRGELARSGGPRLGQLLADIDAALAKARA